MENKSWVTWLFLFAGLYDFIIGIAFLVFSASLFDMAKIPHPSHWGYIQFCSAMLLIFGAMFFAIARNPSQNRNLIPFGMLLKVAYCGVTLYYWTSTDVPFVFKPFVVIDAIMFAAFAVAFVSIKSK